MPHSRSSAIPTKINTSRQPFASLPRSRPSRNRAITQHGPRPPHQRSRRHGAHLRRPRPHLLQIRLRPRRKSASDTAGGSPCLRETHPRLGQRRRIYFAARFYQSLIFHRGSARHLAVCRQRRRWSHRRNPNHADMLEEPNTTVFHFSRPSAELATGKQLPADADVRLTVRVDIEDRNFHWETKRNGGAEHHFASNTGTLGEKADGTSPAVKAGFVFPPARDRQLRVFTLHGLYHPQPEWCENIPHPVEASRGQTGSGDAYSPGWFELPLPKGAERHAGRHGRNVGPDSRTNSKAPNIACARRRPEVHLPPKTIPSASNCSAPPAHSSSGATAARPSSPVIPGFSIGAATPSSARAALLAAGMIEEVKQIVITFARFEKNGTLPNTIYGEDASNRDTSDAPLWFALVCEELARASFPSAPQIQFLCTISRRHPAAPCATFSKASPLTTSTAPQTAFAWTATPPSSGVQAISPGWIPIIPACTPREGYPIEIQALWIRLLRQLEQHQRQRDQRAKSGTSLADQALASLEKLFWLEDRGYYSDVLLARPGQPAAAATARRRAAQQLPICSSSLGLYRRRPRPPLCRSRPALPRHSGRTAQPGAAAVSVPLPIYGNRRSASQRSHRRPTGAVTKATKTRAANPPITTAQPGPGHFRSSARRWPAPGISPRKPSPPPKRTSAAWTVCSQEGCIGQLPEILDGDAPHTQRGCDAQAWGVTEALRVWKLLQEFPS